MPLPSTWSRVIQTLNAEVACFKATGGGHEDMNTKTFPLYEIADDIANWRDEVHTGRGMILLRGVPVGETSTWTTSASCTSASVRISTARSHKAIWESWSAKWSISATRTRKNGPTAAAEN